MKKNNLQEVFFEILFHIFIIHRMLAFICSFGKKLKKWHVNYLKNGTQGQIKPYIFLKEDLFTIPKHIWFIVTPCAVFEIFNDVLLLRRLFFYENYEKNVLNFHWLRRKLYFFSKIELFLKFLYIFSKNIFSYTNLTAFDS